ncbi:MAG: GntR family transcriptional regulator [Gemmobacter sp.]
MNAVVPSTGPDLIVRDIRRGLTEGRYVPGQRLAEPDLMRRYAVSRSTVREALGRLAAEGLVRLDPHRGARIRMLSRAEAADVLRVAEVMLGLAARCAAERTARGAPTAHFSQAAEAFLAAPDDPARRARYYAELARLSGNREIERLLPAIHVPLLRAQLSLPAQDGVAEHRRLVQAVLSGGANRAEASVRRHLRRILALLPDLPDTRFSNGAG